MVTGLPIVLSVVGAVLSVVALWFSYRADARSAAAEQSSTARTLNSAFVLGKTVGNVFGHGLVDERTPPSAGSDNDRGEVMMVAWVERHLPWLEARATPSAEWLGLNLDFRHTLREVWLTTDHFAQYRWQEGVFTPVDLDWVTRDATAHIHEGLAARVSKDAVDLFRLGFVRGTIAGILEQHPLYVKLNARLPWGGDTLSSLEEISEAAFPNAPPGFREERMGYDRFNALPGLFETIERLIKEHNELAKRLELRDLELPMMPGPLPFGFDHHRWIHDLFWRASGPVQPYPIHQ